MKEGAGRGGGGGGGGGGGSWVVHSCGSSLEHLG